MAHEHKCEVCDHIWAHEVPRGVSKEVHEFAHRCPKCGSGPYYLRHTESRDLFQEAEAAFKEIFRSLL